MKHKDKKTDWLKALRDDLGSKWAEYLETEIKDTKRGWFFVSYEKAARAILEWCEYFSEHAGDNIVRKEMDAKLCNYDK
ncbi:hypothetical protein A6V39_05650 [Candidatus Mycoplasma haematobovis]|uniref:Uncharacterized protein n=1 Tax=Candidatus Mycoplasma haematobovis TaxID=432608 RepID=A0A1A9QE19_9MOLU|nr:hypothetical protein [Candidatus Mycoplasma haematobovis]OAL10822.1 hypothetical protein A6V39_05650 [Candidatus Mycoplasma haematobovis]